MGQGGPLALRGSWSARCSSRLWSLQCRTVKISILGDEGVPVQVDGEAWVQPPGYIRIVHKNRAQTLTRDRVRWRLSWGGPGASVFDSRNRHISPPDLSERGWDS